MTVVNPHWRNVSARESEDELDSVGLERLGDQTASVQLGRVWHVRRERLEEVHGPRAQGVVIARHRILAPQHSLAQSSGLGRRGLQVLQELVESCLSVVHSPFRSSAIVPQSDIARTSTGGNRPCALSRKVGMETSTSKVQCTSYGSSARYN